MLVVLVLVVFQFSGSTLLLKFPLLKKNFGITVGIISALALIRCSCLFGGAHVSRILLFGLKMSSVILLVVLVAGCVIFPQLTVCCFMQHCSQIFLRFMLVLLVLVVFQFSGSTLLT